jgi:hypothetical protein
VFADYTGDRLGWLRQCGSRTSPVAVLRKKRDANSPRDPYLTSSSAPLASISAIVEDNAGELYLVTDFSSLYKIVPAP